MLLMTFLILSLLWRLFLGQLLNTDVSPSFQVGSLLMLCSLFFLLIFFKLLILCWSIVNEQCCSLVDSKVSSGQQRDSAINIHISIPPQTPLLKNYLKAYHRQISTSIFCSMYESRDYNYTLFTEETPLLEWPKDT